MSGRIMKWMIAVLLVALVVAIIAPNFVKAKTRTGNEPNCIANLIQIDGAIQQWAIENKKLDSDAVDLTGAAKYLKGGVLPQCPKGGSYQAGATVKDKPTCTKAKEFGHTWPAGYRQ